ncbi:hypothetical protein YASMINEVIRUS_340 [Yasminevirus sp. GU-2018]|uniref:Uncharacterized protein n=1 Tax=Yasminevirus sp. GU-2018 TaxID=2420051 RepID=A0A5K0U7U6_9VIRU|nr:hypothetical protein YASMINEVIRUS_340 [Yasminevirus sp. GU-2018]
MSNKTDNQESTPSQEHSQEHTQENTQENTQEVKAETKKTVQDVVKDYVNKRNTAKQNMMNKLSKQEMVNIIFKQNDLLSQQSSQMLEIVEMANSIEKNARTDEADKCSNIKRASATCAQVNTVRKQQINMYENSVRIQIVLFVLLLTVLAWLLYHYSCSGSTSTTK